VSRGGLYTPSSGGDSFRGLPSLIDRLNRLLYLLCVEEKNKTQQEVEEVEEIGIKAHLKSHRRCYWKCLQSVRECF
jgi:hypothetical protein